MVGSRFPASFHKLDMAKSNDGDMEVGSADSSSDSASVPGSAGSAASVPGSAASAPTPRFVPSPGEDIGMFVESLSFAYVRQRAIVYILRAGVFV